MIPLGQIVPQARAGFTISLLDSRAEVIGKQGPDRAFHPTIMSATAMKMKKRYALDIEEGY